MDRFRLFPWGPVQNRENSRDSYAALRGIADCGFNASGFVTPADYDACRAAGLAIYSFLDVGSDFSEGRSLASDRTADPALVHEAMRRALDGLPRDVAAVYIKDEPGAADFPRLSAMVADVREFAPWAEPYINLFPNYAVCGAPDLSQLETSTYEEYLDRFAAEVRPDAISLDNYLVFISHDFEDRAMEAQYYQNLIQAHDCCRRHGIPFQHVVCSNQLRNYQTPPTFANLAFQAYTSLAAGAKVIAWYTYFGLGGYLFAPIDDNTGEDVRTPTWYLLREVNRQTLAVGQLLYPMTFRGMYFTDPEPIPGARGVGECAALRRFTSDTPCMVGEFDDGGEAVLLIVNTSLRASARVDADMGAPLLAYSVERGGFFPPLLTDSHGNVSPMWLAPGCGIVLRASR